MTNEEAIQYNKNLREYMKINDKKSEYKFSEENYIALDMGNKALEIVNDFESAQIITGGRLNGRTYAYKCGLADGQRLAKGEKIFNILPLEQQPSEDAISRAEAISRIEVRRKITCESDPYNYKEWTKGYEEGIDDAIAMINSVPSVTPQPKMGHWISVDGNSAVCDCCNRLNRLYGVYCKHCGAKMQEVEE